MNMNLYFPTPIWWEETQIDTTDMLKLCYRLRDEDPVGNQLSNEGGWQSAGFRPGVHPEMKVLEDKVLAQAQQCMYDYGYDPDIGFVALENFWFNINNKGNSNMVHIHDTAFVSGAFYLKAKPEQGKITFYKSFSQDFIVASHSRVASYTPISASAISYEPATGKLIMFPGYLPHGVGSNGLDEDRISVSFNVKMIRKDDERYWPTTSK